MVAGFRLDNIFCGQDGAGGVAGLLHLAVLAVEVAFKGVFNAVLAHHGVIGIIQQGVALVLLLGHQARVAQDVGRVLGGVFPDIGPVHLNARQLLLHDGGDQPHAGILHEDVVGGVDGVAHIDGVADTGDDAHLLGCIAVVDIIAGAHIAHQLHSGGVFVQLLALEVGVEHGALDGGHVLVVFKGRLCADRQIVGIAVAKALHHFHQFQNNGVGVLIGEELVRVDLQVITLFVADQNTAVAIQNIATGGSDSPGSGSNLVAAVVILLAFDDLELVEKDQVHRQQHQENDGHGHQPGRFYESLVHCFSSLETQGNETI